MLPFMKYGASTTILILSPNLPPIIPTAEQHCNHAFKRRLHSSLQLLETGLLHADPHPGNLLRTADGRICILDFGMMTQVRAQALTHKTISTTLQLRV